MLKQIIKTIAGHVPGTAANLALKKRAFEKSLRAQGYSRTAAMAVASRHFKKASTTS